MANSSLTACPSCSHNVSTTAYDCPNCGATLKKAKRGLFGNIFKWGFILFNVLMLVWAASTCMAVGEVISESESVYEEAGAAIGGGIGAILIGFIWVIGDIILGLFVLFTRPSKN